MYYFRKIFTKAHEDTMKDNWIMIFRCAGTINFTLTLT